MKTRKRAQVEAAKGKVRQLFGEGKAGAGVFGGVGGKFGGNFQQLGRNQG